MRKRFPALVLLLALVLCVPVRAAGPRLEVHLPENPVGAGEEFAVTVDLLDNPGILHIQFTLAFDRARMECTAIELGDALKGQAMSSLNPAGTDGAVLAAISLESMTADGPVGIFRFRAKESLSDFHFSIEKIYLGNDKIEKYDVTVTNAQPSGGDASNTGESSNNGGTSTDTGTGNGGNTSNTGGSSNNGSTSTNTDTGNNGIPSQENTSLPFTDIAGTWAEAYIRTASERNLFQGYADGTFRPNNRLTRAQFTMVLWNLAGRPEVSGDSPFADMGTQIENFQKAVAWAYSKGLVNGTSATTFSPSGLLTRQAAMKILFAYHGGRRGGEVLASQAYDSIYTDSGQISAWAKDAMYWAVYQNILSGNTPSTLNPGGAVTRAQLAAIMVRYTDRFPS